MDDVYHEDVRRLLQLGTWLLLIITLVTPLSEWFDRWDAPGLSNDVEFAVLALIVSLCLVLLVSRLIASVAILVEMFSVRRLVESDSSWEIGTLCAVEFMVPPPKITPLRI